MKIFNYYHESETETLEPVFTKGKLISYALTGLKRTDYQRATMSAAQKKQWEGKKMSAETRAKIAKKASGRKYSEETRAKLAELMTDEKLLKMRMKRGFMWHTPFGVFDSAMKAAIALNADNPKPHMIKKWCRDEKKSDYFRKRLDK